MRASLPVRVRLSREEIGTVRFLPGWQPRTNSARLPCCRPRRFWGELDAICLEHRPGELEVQEERLEVDQAIGDRPRCHLSSHAETR